MSAFSDLRKKLAELFQLDAAAELDFGIYRILNARRVEIEGFLDSLEPQVETILAEALQTGTGELKAELEKVEAGLRAGGIDEAMISSAPKVKELREKIASAGGDPTAITHEIFSLLTTFFGRYYKDGDFLSLRRYKKDTYAIPYEGEEVKLHWANADQYYIKSAETYRDYSFKLGPSPKDDKPDTRPTVTFKLTEADAERDNNKAVAGQERRFVYQGLHQDCSLPENLILSFAHLPIGKAEKQAALNESAAAAILAERAKGPFTGLAANDPTYTVKSKTRSILAKHLSEYTGKNSFDYFIHKDLGGFLRRELDFFIKNEVVHLDDLDDAPESNWKETRAKIKALRTISGKVIRFLAQIENFQKKLWLKKKFVTACDYVVTLDRLPEELYPEIAACDAQREEWVRLFAIDEIGGDLGRVGYSVPLTVEFLKENSNLSVDSRLLSNENRSVFTKEIKRANFNLNGSLLRGDNSQGLSALASSLSGGIDCIYIDPPYNTAASEILYKNEYKDSSWLCFIDARLRQAKSLLQPTGVICATIDDCEQKELGMLMDSIFGMDRHLGTLAIRCNPSGRPTKQGFSLSHEYAIYYGRSDFSAISKIERSEDQLSRFDEKDAQGVFEWRNFRREGSDSSRSDRPRMYYPIHVFGGLIRIPKMIWDDPEEAWKILEEPEQKEIIVWPIDDSGNQRRWRWSHERVTSQLDDFHARVPRGGSISVYYKYRPNSEGAVPTTVWAEARHSAVEHGTGTIKNLFGKNAFSYPKSVFAVQDCIAVSGARKKDSTILDFFAGSGTTGHAVINLNREDGGDRKYILIEMGEHFDTVLVPRLKKVIYSKDWKDGKPQSRNTGISHCFKILRLESYEDTLNNLRLHRTREQELALEKFSPEAREDYQLGYMLDLEANGSQSLLNVSAFTDPFNYTLQIATGTAGETKPTQVDLVETFSWLLGLTVLAQGQGGGVTWVEGTNPEGEKVLVLWRNTTEVDAEALNAWCKKQKISVLDGEFAMIYVNGDHHLENLRRDDQTWKVRLTDEEFPKLMWEGCE